MLVKGTCIVCKEEKNVIDTVSICADCIFEMRTRPGVSAETKEALKWLLNAQYGAIKQPPEIGDYYTNPCRLCSNAIDGRPESSNKCVKYPRPHEDGRPECPFRKRT